MSTLTMEKIREAARLMESVPPMPRMEVHSSSALTVQFRFPVSKRKRIRRKWAKNKANWKPSTKIYMTQDGIICHPVMAQVLRETVRQMGKVSPGFEYFMHGMLGW